MAEADYSLLLTNLLDALYCDEDNPYTTEGTCVFALKERPTEYDLEDMLDQVGNPKDYVKGPAFITDKDYRKISEAFSDAGFSENVERQPHFILAHLGGWRSHKRKLSNTLTSLFNDSDSGNRAGTTRKEFCEDLKKWKYYRESNEIKYFEKRKDDSSLSSKTAAPISELIVERNYELVVDFAKESALFEVIKKFSSKMCEAEKKRSKTGMKPGEAEEKGSEEEKKPGEAEEKGSKAVKKDKEEGKRSLFSKNASKRAIEDLQKCLERMMEEYEKSLKEGIDEREERDKRCELLARALSWLVIGATLRDHLTSRLLEDDLPRYFPKRNLIRNAEEWKDSNKAVSVAVPQALNTIPAAVELIGRDKAIQDIRDLLGKNKIVNIHADGGVGKTALAAQIINGIKDEVVSGNSPYEHVAWITSTGNLEKDLPSVFREQSPEKNYNAASVFLQTTPTFLVIDNMDEPPERDEVNELNTISGKTKILITTRAEIPIGETYNLGDLAPENALILLYKQYIKGKNLTIDQIKAREDHTYAQSIAKAASYNALFIELIGKMAYKEHWKLDALWKELEKDVFGKESKHTIPTNHGEGRLLAQIENLYKMSSLSDRQKEIMSFIALFPAEHSIFFDVFEWAGFEKDEVDNLGELERRGWIERSDEGYLIHTMVKGSVEQQGKTFFDENRYEELINELADTDQYLSVDKGYTVIRERIVVPETICRLLVEQESEKGIVAKLFHNLAGVYSEQGNYAEALKYYNLVLSICEEKLGKDHLSIALTYNNIAEVYRKQGNYAEALKYYNLALSINEEKLGKDHPDTATTYNNVGLVYSEQGNYTEAIKYYNLALSIYE